jgi:23S rRNA (guanosine2251-2'-O)-methyltransferase
MVLSMKDFYIYGRNAIIEQLLHHPKNLKRIMIKDNVKSSGFEQIRELALKNRIPVDTTDEKEITKLLKDEVSHQGVIAISRPFEYTSFEEWMHIVDINTMPTVLILDHIMDVSNLGAIIRSATAAGVAAIIVAELNQAPVTSAVYKTSAGTVGRVPLIQVGNLNQIVERFKKAGFWIVGLAIDENHTGGSTDLWHYNFDTPTVVVIGGEGDGIRQKTREHCDVLLSIPMENSVESLNAAVSSALVCYEIKRQRSVK